MPVDPQESADGLRPRRYGQALGRFTDLFSAVEHPPFAAALMVFALSLLSLQDGIVKLTSDAVSLWQFQALRSTFNLVLLFSFIALFGGWRLLPPKRFFAVALRSFLLVGAMLFFFSGAPFLALAEIAAGFYLFPLIVTLLSRFVLGEHVGPRRLFAVGAGLCGSMLILKPGAESFQFVSLMPICAGFFYACMVLTTRRMCREESPLTLTCGAATVFLLVGVVGLLVFPPPQSAGSLATAWPYLLTGWHPLSWLVIIAVMACSAMNLVANICLARAYQSAESSWLAPYDYSYLVFAALWGYLIWGTVPDALTLLGMAIIALAGIYVATRPAQ